MIENLDLTPLSLVRSLSGLNTDVKPTKNIGTGSRFYEINTGDTYVYSVLNISPITESGWWKIPANTGGGGTGVVVIDEIMESATRVFVTPEQRDMIGQEILPDIDTLEESATRVFVTPEQRDMIGQEILPDIDTLEESATRVFVTPEQRDMIGQVIDPAYILVTTGNEENDFVSAPGSVNVGTMSLAGSINAHAEGHRTFAVGGYAQDVTAVDLEEQTVTLENVYGIEADSYICGLTSNNTVVQFHIVFVDEDTSTLTVEGLTSTITQVIINNPTAGAHTEGVDTVAVGRNVHAEGENTKAFGDNSHVEGFNNVTFANASHAEGFDNKLLESAVYSHVEGQGNTVKATYSHVEGQYHSTIEGTCVHVEGYSNTTTSNAQYSHVEGQGNTVSHTNAHAEGGNNTVSNQYGHAEGQMNTVSGQSGHAEGFNNVSEGECSHVEGMGNLAKGQSSHAEGNNTKAYDNASHAEGNNTNVGDPDYSGRAQFGHAEGNSTSVQAHAGHAEGINTTVTGEAGHAEGTGCTASGKNSHAEGTGCTASGKNSHAEGAGTTASGENSHAEGAGCTAAGALSHAGGNGAQTTEGATGAFSHGSGCVAQLPFQVVFGQNNAPNTTDAMQYGLGGHNIFALDMNGWITNGPANHSVSNKISKINVEAEAEETIEVPSDDAVYLLKVVQDTSTVLYVLADTSAEILLGTALTDVTVAHTDDNTWTVTNADTANAATVTIKRFM